MYLLKLAFDNLRFNIKRTISLIFIISVASAAIILYQGYVEYCSQGMMVGFISSSGHLQVLPSSNSTEDTESYISAEELQTLEKIFSENNHIKRYDNVLIFNGLIGNEDKSAIFWGKGIDNVEKYFTPKYGKPIFDDDEKILIGGALAEKLHFKFLENQENFVSLMCNSSEIGICLASSQINGIIETGIPQNDEGLLVTNRTYALSLLEMEDSASYIQIYLSDNNCKKAVLELEDAFRKNNLNFTIRTWEELNPSFSQINKLNEIQFFMISIILGILIFIALMQSLSTAYFERLTEFGTLEAIGMNKKDLGLMLCFETFYMFLIGILLSLFISFGANFITDKFNISMNPPGYDISYQLMFCLLPNKILLAFAFVFKCCVLATISPVFSICKNSSIKLINHK